MVPGAFCSPSLLRLLEEEGQNKSGGTGKGSHRCTSRPAFNPASLSPAMSPPFRSGVYVSRRVALLLAGLTAVLLLVLVALAALYGSCAHDLWEEDTSWWPPGDPEWAQPNPTHEPTVGISQDVAPPSGPWDHLRLPPWLVPLHYDLELWPSLQPDNLTAPNLTFTGRVNITVRCTVATSRLLLHSFLLNYKQVEVWGPLTPDPRNATVRRVPVENVWFAQDMQFVVLELGQSLEPGRSYELNFDFSGQLLQVGYEGLFVSYHIDKDEYR